MNNIYRMSRITRKKDCIVKEIEKYNKARIEVESPFIGSPYGPALLVKSLITLADPGTGIVKGITYQKIASIMTINPAPGRKDSGAPTKQTIRNYIKSIERECSEYFKVISEGQNLQFIFPELPKIFSKFFEDREVNTVAEATKNQCSTEQNIGFDEKVNTEVNTPDFAVKNNIINININKQTNTNPGLIFSCKKTIADNFYPDAETIEIALAKGYVNVIDVSEIAAFIHHNKTNKTQWADFNPIYIRWLERKEEYLKQQKQKVQKQLRSNCNERRIHKKTTQQSALQRVSELHGISCDSLWDSPSPGNSATDFAKGRLIEAVDETNSTVWTAFY